ncbi:MAG: N-acetylcysteine deacetylase [Desulfovibrio sp.]
MPYDFLAKAEAVEKDVIAWRRRFHENPELGFEERETAAFITERLKEFGYSPRCIGGTGVAADLVGTKTSDDKPGITLGLRADIDALPGEEKTGLPFASKKPGVMHSCGHDAHGAILLGVAKVLAECKDSFTGKIKFFFQPAEEILGGAKTFVDAGELDDVDGLAALHVMTDLEVGHVGCREGVALAATDTLTITVSGKAAHGAQPHRGNDAIVAAAHIVTALQSVVSRTVSPLDSVVLTIGKIEGGFAPNVIPANATLRGTLRSLKSETRATVISRMHEIVEHTAKALGCEATLEVFEGTPPLYCDAAWVERFVNVAKRYVPEERIHHIAEPSMGGEDFAFMLQKAPGVFWRLGVRTEGAERTNAHSPYFMIDESAFKYGVAIASALAVEALQSPCKTKTDKKRPAI